LLNLEHSTIEQIAKRLVVPIPPAYHPPPKPQGSWRTLKPGQFLENITPVHLPNVPFLTPGTQFEITGCNSAGVELTVYGRLTNSAQIAKPPTLRWTHTDWEKTFKKIRKPTKRSPKNEIPSPAHS